MRRPAADCSSPSPDPSVAGSPDAAPATEDRPVAGERFGWLTAPSLIHRYAVPGAPEEVEQALAAAFGADGWTVEPDRYVVRGFTALPADRAVEAQVTVAPEPAGEEEARDDLPTVAPGLVLIEVNVGADPCPPGDPGCA